MASESDDAGDPAVLRRMIAPKVLHLKPSCPVMLQVNLSDTLVNGSHMHHAQYVNESMYDERVLLNFVLTITRQYLIELV